MRPYKTAPCCLCCLKIRGMNIVVLDSRPTDDGDLDWAPLRELGHLTLHERTSPAQVLERIREAEVVFTNKVRLTRQAFEAAPHLKYVGEMATGTDNIDLAAAREHGVTVCNVAGYSGDFTAQLTWALILELASRAGDHSRLVHQGAWSECPDFSFWSFPLVELSNKTLLIVGLGNIGRRVARIGAAFNMNVLSAILPNRQNSGQDECRRVELDEALGLADVVSLHCPLTPQTRGLMNARRLAMLKPWALLVNTGRGPLVEDAPVRAALESGALAAYGADVLFPEPPPRDHPLLGAPRCILTPHLAWASPEARQRLLHESIDNLRGFVSGEPRNVVS